MPALQLPPTERFTKSSSYRKIREKNPVIFLNTPLWAFWLMTGGKAGSATVASGKGIWRPESGKSAGFGGGGPVRENTKVASKSAGFYLARGAISGPMDAF